MWVLGLQDWTCPLARIFFSFLVWVSRFGGGRSSCLHLERFGVGLKGSDTIGK